MILMLHVKSIKFEHIADYIHPKMKCCCSSPVADLELGRIDFFVGWSYYINVGSQVYIKIRSLMHHVH